MKAALFVLVLLLAAPSGYAPLRRLGLGTRAAWAGARTMALLLVAWVGWWAGVAGCGAWWSVGVGAGVALLAWGVRTLVRDRREWRRLVGAEAVFLTGSLAVLWMRIDRPEIVDTEKLMDLGIAATLLRTRGFPPPDMWLAGEPLAYYYWGSLTWTVPLKLSSVPLELGYNLIVAAIGGLVAVLAWALAGRLCGSRWALPAAFLTVFAGTPAGLQQWLAGGSIDLWASSRQIPHTITEFPLFTLWLGDLHPHLLSVPAVLLALLVAAHAREDGPKAARTASLALLFGVTWAANPWAMPPTLVGIGAVLVARAGMKLRTVGSVVGVGVGGWLAAAPFHLAFAPPFRGIGLVHAWTRVDQLLLYGGVLLIPAAVAAWHSLGHSVAGAGPKTRATHLSVGALLVVSGAVTGRPTAVFLAAILVLLLRSAARSGEPSERCALMLAALGVFLFMAPEVLYVVDPYGEGLHRMNTVFKSYFQGWILMGLTFPVLLRTGIPRRRVRTMVAVALLLVSVPHLWAVVIGPLSARSWSLDGLRWMAPGDRAAVRYLRRTPPKTVLVEAVGDAYTRHARLASAAGVPTVLGWANHEIVWRGDRVRDEVDRRHRLVDRLYTCGDPAEVRRIGKELGVDLIAVGAMERAAYPSAGLDAVVASGPPVLEGGTVLVRLKPEGGSA